MNCNEAGTLLAQYADGEVDNLQGRSIEQHLRGCGACATKHEGVLARGAQIRAKVPYFPAPPALRERVRALLANAHDAAPARPRPERDRWRWLTGGALAGCTATMLAWTLGTAVITWHANEDVAVEAVAIHHRVDALVDLRRLRHLTMKSSARATASTAIAKLADC